MDVGINETREHKVLGEIDDLGTLGGIVPAQESIALRAKTKKPFELGGKSHKSKSAKSVTFAMRLSTTVTTLLVSTRPVTGSKRDPHCR